DRATERLRVVDVGDVRGEAGAETRRHARSEVLPERRRGDDDGLEALLLHDVGDGGGVRVGEVVRERGPVDGDDVDAVLREPVGERVDALAENDGGRLAARLLGERLAGRDGDERGLRELAVDVLRNDENVAHDRRVPSLRWPWLRRGGASPAPARTRP